MIKGKAVTNFRDKYAFLSNFYNVDLEVEGITYLNAEAAFQAQKCTTDEEKAVFSKLSPKEAKQQGRKVNLRTDWEEVKDAMMYKILIAKFTQNVYLAELLVDTYPMELIEGNTWGDRYWGVCNGQGQNMLGKLLMQVRDKISESYL